MGLVPKSLKKKKKEPYAAPAASTPNTGTPQPSPAAAGVPSVGCAEAAAVWFCKLAALGWFAMEARPAPCTEPDLRLDSRQPL